MAKQPQQERKCLKEYDFQRIYESISKIENSLLILSSIGAKLEGIEDKIDRYDKAINGNGKLGLLTKVELHEQDLLTIKSALDELNDILNGENGKDGLKDTLNSLKTAVIIYSSIFGAIASIMVTKIIDKLF